jgi:hypothetical protein
MGDRSSMLARAFSLVISGLSEGIAEQKVSNKGRMARPTSLPEILPFGLSKCLHESNSGDPESRSVFPPCIVISGNQGSRFEWLRPLREFVDGSKHIFFGCGGMKFQVRHKFRRFKGRISRSGGRTPADDESVTCHRRWRHRESGSQG